MRGGGTMRRERYGGTRGSLATVAGGLAAAAAMLVSTVLPAGGGSGPDGNGGSRGGADGTGSGHRAAPAALPGSPTAPLMPAAERETCADDSDPAASLKPSDAAGPAVERIQDAGRLVVGVDQNSYLWGYRDPSTGELAGFDIDLVRAIAEDLLGDEPKIVYKTIPTDQRIPAIRGGDVDMVVRTMTVNCERIEQVAFSTAYFVSGQQLVVPKRNSDITGLDKSIGGKRICNAEGSTAEKLLEREEFAKLDVRQIKVGNQLDCLVRLQLGQADAVLTDNALGAGQAAQDPSVELIGEPATIEPYGVAMNLEDEDLVRRVNKVLEDYRKGGDDSRWRASYDEWLADMMETGTDGPPGPPAPVYRD